MISRWKYHEFEKRRRLWMKEISFAELLILNIYDPQTRGEYLIC